MGVDAFCYHLTLTIMMNIYSYFYCQDQMNNIILGKLQGLRIQL